MQRPFQLRDFRCGLLADGVVEDVGGRGGEHRIGLAEFGGQVFLPLLDNPLVETDLRVNGFPV